VRNGLNFEIESVLICVTGIATRTVEAVRARSAVPTRVSPLIDGFLKTIVDPSVRTTRTS